MSCLVVVFSDMFKCSVCNITTTSGDLEERFCSIGPCFPPLVGVSNA